MKDKSACLSQLSEIDLKLKHLRSKLRNLTETERDNLQKEKIVRRFENLEKKKTKLLVNFDLNLRAYIQKLENRYDNTGVLRMANALCSGCHMRLPTREVNLLQTQNTFVICSFCGRIVLSYPIEVEKGAGAVD